MDEAETGLYFRLFNEIGIIDQLGRTLLEARLPAGLLASHFAILNHLVRLGDGRTPLAIANAFQVPKTTMTHSLGVLERHGLIRLAPNPADGRSKLVGITEEGRALRDRTIAAFAPVVEGARHVLTPEEVEAILPALARLRAHLDESREG